MKKTTSFWSIFWGVTIILAAGCGRESGKSPGEEPAAVTRATPESAGETLKDYRERGIEPRRARFSREWED